MAIISGYDVRMHGQIPHGDLGFDNDSHYEEFIESDIIPVVEEIIERHCGVPADYFAAGGATVTDEYHDGDGRENLWLKYRPIVSVTTLSRNKAGLTSAVDWEDLTEGPGASSHFLLYGDRGFIYIYGRQPGIGHKNIKVTYLAGYTLTPEPVTLVCKELAANVLRGMLKRKLMPQNITGVLVEGGDIQSLFAEELGMTKAQKRLLVPFRLSRVSVG
ncbi:hypothetical protein ES707_12218 [subsurface metagenome]